MRPRNVEQILTGHLRAQLGVHVGTRVPAKRPATFVRLFRAGGTRANLVQAQARVVVECWGADEGAAWTLTEQAYAALDALEFDPAGLPFAQVELTEPVNYPDTSSGTPRWQFIATFTTNLQE